MFSGISELAVKDGLVGELFANIIGEQFRRMKFGDRFWYETNDRTVRFDNSECHCQGFRRSQMI